ncbi:sensor histidine kinase [Arthrobacter sp. G119Y2]|uniref:sensor histidine kinase n=1 Tax=Arthrobacter sp. G119Y2 TaxID=3134965 RepID=UPI0031193BF4
MLVHRRIQAWMQANPFKVDLFQALTATLIFAVPFLLTFQGQQVEFVLSAAICLPLAWKRTRPVAAAAIQAAACLLQLVLVPETGLPADIFVLVTVYSLAVYAPRWASLSGLALALVGGMLFIFQYYFVPLRTAGWIDDSAGLIGRYLALVVALDAVVLLCWTFGDLARTRRLAMDALRDHARRLEVERQQERDLAAADERTHIAREMHDIVAHSLSVIITQADGARYASAQDPEIAAKTLGTIAETGRGSLREMRRLLGVLRGDELASTRPLPSLADVSELVDAVKRAGLSVTVSETGTMRRPLPAGAELTAYRVIQESLTNVLKHAGPSVQAGVDLQWTPRGLEITVHDDGRGAGADAPPPAPPAPESKTPAGTGQGINGMTERVALYDGTLVAAPAAGGGFRVSAFIPYTEA